MATRKSSSTRAPASTGAETPSPKSAQSGRTLTAAECSEAGRRVLDIMDAGKTIAALIDQINVIVTETEEGIAIPVTVKALAIAIEHEGHCVYQMLNPEHSDESERRLTEAEEAANRG